jgi:hypothetical protein
MIVRSVQEALAALPPTFRTDAAKNTLDYVFASIGHKCLFIVKSGDQLFQLQLRPNKISNHYRRFLPKTLKKKPNVRLLHCIVKEFKKETTETDFVTLELFQAYEKAGHVIPQGVYLVSPTDALIYRKNFKDPFYHVTGSTHSPIALRRPLLPILAWSGHKDYLDAPLPMIDDFNYVRGVDKVDMSKVELDFSKRNPLPYFAEEVQGVGGPSIQTRD